MSDELGKIKVAVEAQGVDETNKKLDALEGGDGGLLPDFDMPSIGGGEESGGGGGMLGGIMDMISGMSVGMMAAVAGIAAIVGLLLSMEPIQQMLKGFMKIFQAFMVPLAVLIMRLLAPVMRFMLKLLPLWMAFFDDPVGSLKGAFKALWEWMKDLPGMIWNFIKELPSLIFQLIRAYLKMWMKLGSILWNALKDLGSWLWDKLQVLPSKIWSFMKKLPSMIADSITDFGSDILSFQTGGVMPRDGLAYLHENERIFNPQQLDRLIREFRRGSGGRTHIQISGGLDSFIENIEADPNRRR